METRSLMDMTLVSGTIEPCVNTDIGTSSDAINNGIAGQPVKRKKAMTSLYLKYFETAPDGKTRRCKFCKQSYSIATATGIVEDCHTNLLLLFYCTLHDTKLGKHNFTCFSRKTSNFMVTEKYFTSPSFPPFSFRKVKVIIYSIIF